MSYDYSQHGMDLHADLWMICQHAPSVYGRDRKGINANRQGLISTGARPSSMLGCQGRSLYVTWKCVHVVDATNI